MKRGKDDDKVTGPLFPRLHVNDTDKGGPRAPPRNKMALYEQLSIPSQRFNGGVLPLDPNKNNSSLPMASSSQGTGPERNLRFPLPPATPTHRAEKYISCQSSGANLSISLAPSEQGKKVDEDDFRVPIYVQSRMGACNNKSHKSNDNEKLTPSGSTYQSCFVEKQNAHSRDPKQNGSPCLNVRRYVRIESEGHPKVNSPSKEQMVKSSRNMSSGENIHGQTWQADASLYQKGQDCSMVNSDRLQNNDACLRQESGVGSQSTDSGDNFVNSTMHKDKEDVSKPRGCFPSVDDRSSPVEIDYDIRCHDNGTGASLQTGKVDKNDVVSKTSVVDTVSGMDITPDDVVGIIGQKRFWKARRAIVNQQRLFAVQVFELHRLIKVQQLIAGSPDMLLEDAALLDKSPLKGSPTKKLSLEYVVKSRPESLKRKDNSEKLHHKTECSAENAVGKTSLSSVKNGSHLSNYAPFSGNPNQPTAAATDYNKMGPWCFHQSPGHQWLIPVMSPSEGLVYKPYPGPGFNGTVCGGCGPLGPGPVTSNFVNPVFGVPASHQGFGILPGTSPFSHPYFPPYGTPVANSTVSGTAVEQVNLFGGPRSRRHSDRSSGEGANFNTNNQSSCNLPDQRNRPISEVMKSRVPKESELQGSTASSPSEMSQGASAAQNAEGRDALPLFPAAPVVPELSPQPCETEQPIRVIKVVPHNPRSATESAVRIFQSIQEERKQLDSI